MQPANDFTYIGDIVSYMSYLVQISWYIVMATKYLTTFGSACLYEEE